MSLAASGDAYRVTARVAIPAGATLLFNLRGHTVGFGNTTANGGSGPVTLQSVVQTIEILMDRASVESFANDGEYSCTRCFTPTSNGITATAQGGTVTILSMEVHPVRSMWEGQ
jgi:sucrose-6-phosphate hydrolase SacC (GH32 family)